MPKYKHPTILEMCAEMEKALQDNPELPNEFVKDILHSKNEDKSLAEPWDNRELGAEYVRRANPDIEKRLKIKTPNNKTKKAMKDADNRASHKVKSADEDFLGVQETAKRLNQYAQRAGISMGKVFEDGNNEYTLKVEYIIYGNILDKETFELELIDKIMEVMDGHGMLCGGAMCLTQNMNYREDE